MPTPQSVYGPSNYRQAQRSRFQFYSLCNQFNKEGVIFLKTLDNSIDIETGKLETKWREYPLIRCLALNLKDALTYRYSLSFMAANRNFVYGAYSDRAYNTLVVSRDELTVPIDINDNVKSDNVIWNIKQYHHTDDGILTLLFLTTEKQGAKEKGDR